METENINTDMDSFNTELAAVTRNIIQVCLNKASGPRVSIMALLLSAAVINRMTKMEHKSIRSSEDGLRNGLNTLIDAIRNVRHEEFLNTYGTDSFYHSNEQES